jgi:hypothetical protein
MEAPKVRLSKVLGDVSMKLERMLPKDRANLRAAFDQVVTETSDKEGRCDGLALFKRLNEVVNSSPDEGPARDTLNNLVDRLAEERSYRGENWLADTLAQTLREGIKCFGEDKADLPGSSAPADHDRRVSRRPAVEK